MGTPGMVALYKAAHGTVRSIVSVETVSAASEAWAKALTDAGFRIREVTGENSGLNIIVARENRFEGGADPRREGVALEVVK